MAKYRFTGGFYLETGPGNQLQCERRQLMRMRAFKNFTNGAEFAWGTGLGYQSPIGLGIGARYNVGLTRVDNVNQANARM